LVGLKENVIIGKLIPAGTGMKRYRNISIYSDLVDSLEPPEPEEEIIDEEADSAVETAVDTSIDTAEVENAVEEPDVELTFEEDEEIALTEEQDDEVLTIDE
jgi:DNA-directed RNA polymerase subunit beta'